MPPFDKLRRATVPAPNFQLLTRVMQDRRLAKGAGLYATGANFQAADTRTIVLPRRGPHEPGRTARLTLRFGTVVLKRPRGRARDLLPSVRLTLVEVAEHDPPAGVEPLHRRRLTTHDVTSVDAAWQIVAWYKLRRIIEPLFRIPKKQGLQLEDSQIASAERLLKLATIATKAAALILQLVQARDGRRAEPASLAFTQEERAALEAVNAQVEGKTEKQKNPHTRRGLAWAAWIIARLGGWPFDKLRRLLLLPAARSHHLQAWPGILSRPRYGMEAEKCVHPLARRRGWRHHGHQAPRRRGGERQRHTRAKPRACKSLFEKMRHLVERDHDGLGRHRRFGPPAGFVTNPLEDRDIADPEKASDAAKAHIAHGIKHQRQSLHCRRLAARRRVREIASAGLALVALQISNRSPLDVIRRLTALADNPAHGSSF